MPLIASKQSSQQAMHTCGPPMLQLAPTSNYDGQEEEEDDELVQVSATARGGSDALHVGHTPSFLPFLLKCCFLLCTK